MKILIVSDTHGNISNLTKVINNNKYDYVIHAGDFCVGYSEIKKYVDYVVAGNNDFEGEKELFFEIDGIKFVLLHGEYFDSFFDYSSRYKKMVDHYSDKNVDVIISGHTHIEYCELISNVLCINPGSLYLPRNHSRTKTYAELIIENKKIIDCVIKELD
ncbi:metallophosphoesterase family protein [Malacoplasma iowae]|uniref:Phosphoesterase n=1 Tax=Malacoplasma iowae DK-CPA TaxID=1394179 RepID=A0A084U2M0_MALIO|nr:metallophosphoesterase [Malacoplasma iowae]KFB07206.1 YfcE-related metallophosphatase superfamily protein [Malacoplasma iowae DK-CPA]WPL37106.1 metallophosphoesterase [Malacoplasma iowae]WPL37773.1 metallophosphoesterase [Malacoplasma iowae]WPL39702.1 metallophosphoesterase [Malacoplasma iowae]WPL40662.1 metallophosphoesterase [Malacoplasma iowae]